MALRQKFLKSLTPSELEYLEHDWSFWGRPNQQLTDEDWFVWLILAGRGWGKTRTAVECISQMLRGKTPLSAPSNAPEVMSIIADSPFDMRQYTIEGPSGFMNVGPPDYRPLHEPSKKTLTWPNGAKALLFSSEDPEALRGASGSFFWWDELAKSRYAKAGWSNMLFGMREGNPRGIVTTTPRPIALIRDLLKRTSTKVTIGSTFDNRENLSPIFYREVIEPLQGTRLGRQEINAEILDDVPGALWTTAMIEATRLTGDLPDMARIVVALDPSGTGGDPDSQADSVGIVVAGKGIDGRAYILADRTCDLSPAGWGARAVDAYDEFKADKLIAERNYGGAMVEHVIRTVDPSVNYGEVVASRGKVVRAEPVAALYEQGRVGHVAGLELLEAQMMSMSKDGYAAEGSPDRLDAAVWALTELMLDGSGYTLAHVV